MTLEPYFAELRFKAVPIQEVTVRFELEDEKA